MCPLLIILLPTLSSLLATIPAPPFGKTTARCSSDEMHWKMSVHCTPAVFPLSLFFLGKFHVNINGNFAHKFSQAKIVHNVLIELRKSWVVVVVVIFPPWRNLPGAERPVPSARVCMYRRPNSSYRFSDALSSDVSWGSHGRKIAGKGRKKKEEKNG